MKQCRVIYLRHDLMAIIMCVFMTHSSTRSHPMPSITKLRKDGTEKVGRWPLLMTLFHWFPRQLVSGM